jgi:hypothetical protein
MSKLQKKLSPRLILSALMLSILTVVSCGASDISETSLKGLAIDEFRAAEKDIFYGKVSKYVCQDIVNFNEICLVGVENLEVEEPSGERYIAIIFHGDFAFETGSFVRVGAEVRVDLTYTDEVDNQSALRDLSKKFLKKYRYFIHPSWSYGGFDDVIDILPRD